MDCTASLSCIGWASCSSQDQHHKIVPGWTFVCRISFKNIDTKDIFIQIRTQQGRYPFLYTIQQKIYKLDKLKKRKKKIQFYKQFFKKCLYVNTWLQHWNFLFLLPLCPKSPLCYCGQCVYLFTYHLTTALKHLSWPLHLIQPWYYCR